MTLKIELSHEEADRLMALAKRQGSTLPQLARRALGLEAEEDSPSGLSEADWESLEAELASGIDPSTPPLTDEAVSRESIYAHRA